MALPDYGQSATMIMGMLRRFRNTPYGIKAILLPD